MMHKRYGVIYYAGGRVQRSGCELQRDAIASDIGQGSEHSR